MVEPRGRPVPRVPVHALSQPQVVRQLHGLDEHLTSAEEGGRGIPKADGQCQGGKGLKISESLADVLCTQPLYFNQCIRQFKNTKY